MKKPKPPAEPTVRPLSRQLQIGNAGYACNALCTQANVVGGPGIGP